jgi:hypothetical protein
MKWKINKNIFLFKKLYPHVEGLGNQNAPMQNMLPTYELGRKPFASPVMNVII